jgi:hypothetical protein
MRGATLVLLIAVTAAACTAGSGMFTEIALDTAAPSTPAELLLGGGRAFGECGGFCLSELVLRTDGRVILELSRWDGERPRTISNRGTLSTEALALARALAARLDRISREETYGCPDCTDAGAAWVQTWTKDMPVRSTYDYGRPPRSLAPADRFLAGLIDALDACEATDAVMVEPDCTPRPSY